MKTEIEEAAEANGISEKTLYRAKRDLKVEAKKDRKTPEGPWSWQLGRATFADTEAATRWPDGQTRWPVRKLAI